MSADNNYSEEDDSLFDNCEHEDDDWGELDEMEDNISFNNNTQKRAETQCWKCCECHTINNIRLTMQQYDWKCCECHNVSYLPDATPIIFTSKWNTNNNYKQIKIWICQYCTFYNTNLNSSTCEMCDHQKESTVITKFIDISKEKGEATIDTINDNVNKNALSDKENEDGNDLQKEIDVDIKRLKMQKKTIKMKKEREKIENMIQSKIQSIKGIENEIDNPWKCPHCDYLNRININKCKQCQCNKPQKIPNLKVKVELIVLGFCEEFCRQNKNKMNIPIAIQLIIYKYYDNIKNKDLFGSIYRNNWILKRNCKYRKYICNIQNNYFIKGIYIACNYMTIYRWRFIIKVNRIGDESPLKGFGIGLINTRFLNKNYEQDTIENHANYKKDGNILILNDKSRKGYCRAFNSNDIITMELNFIKRTLSFGINNEWYGNFTNIRYQHYQTVIHNIKHHGDVDIENIDLDIIELGKQTKHNIKPKAKMKIPFGTFEYDFKPYQELSNQYNKIYYYQHLCVGNSFGDKSAEELQFEDIYHDNQNDENYINNDMNDAITNSKENTINSNQYD